MFIGLISIGDIQRALLDKEDLSQSVEKFIRSDILYVSANTTMEEIKKKMVAERIECMPVVDNGELVDIVEWDYVMPEKMMPPQIKNIPVFIMAGGEGTRLKPLTNYIPKPLIPISDKTIIEEIIERFSQIGCNEFIISLNYKADEVEAFFSEREYNNINISFVRESEPLGTGGSIYLAKERLDTTFIVTNCDILVDVNMKDLLAYHHKSGNIATIVSVIMNFPISYGILETAQEGELQKIKEKPSLTYQVNSGLYVLEPGVIDFIKEGERINITDLFTRIMEKDKSVGVFPIQESGWTDMGNWNSYLKTIGKDGNI